MVYFPVDFFLPALRDPAPFAPEVLLAARLPPGLVAFLLAPPDLRAAEAPPVLVAELRLRLDFFDVDVFFARERVPADRVPARPFPASSAVSELTILLKLLRWPPAVVS